MAKYKSFVENAQAFFLIIFFPAGSMYWIMHHRNQRNWPFWLLTLYGLAMIGLILRCVAQRLIPEYWVAGCMNMLFNYGILYFLGIIIFSVLSHRKAKQLKTGKST